MKNLVLNKERITPTWYQIFEFSGLILFLSFTAFNFYLNFTSYLDINIYLLVLIPVSAWVFADFTSGLIHWLADNYGNEDTPLFGKGLIHPFREHHSVPLKMVTHTFTETNGSLLFGSSLFLTFCFYLPPSLSLFLFVWCLFTAFTNQFHKWSHMPVHKLGSFPRLLQKMGLIISLKKHLKHHSGNFDQYYCITSGITNPLLSKLRFWTFLESVIKRLQASNGN